jgi:membrane protein implicated in regulation of membrane protease activity
MFEWLNQWWAEIPTLERIFWFLAIPSSVISLLQLILEFVGMSGDSMDADLDMDVNADIDADISDGSAHHTGSDLRIFTIRGLIIFFTLFGWAGIAFSRTGLPAFFVIGVSFLIGFAAMVLVAWLFKTLYGLSESGTSNIANAIGHRGTVYFTIPAGGQSSGQIQITFQGSFHTLDAITYENEDIRTGTNVKVTEVLEDGTLVVVNDFTIE